MKNNITIKSKDFLITRRIHKDFYLYFMSNSLKSKRIVFRTRVLELNYPLNGRG